MTVTAASLPVLFHLQIDQWIDFAQKKFHPGLLKDVDTALAGRSFLVGHGITLADLAIFGFIQSKSVYVQVFSYSFCCFWSSDTHIFKQVDSLY